MPQPNRERALELPGVVYRLLRKLGRGSFGEVWLAEAPGNVQVAVKIIARAIRDDEADRELKALQVIKGLRHQFLLSIHAYFVQEDQLVIVYELADGNLRQRLTACRQAGQSGIPAPELLGYFREAAEALDYLHDNDVHHRDIKSENLLLLGRHAKVADYGLARMLEKQSLQTASMVGTPAYMAPEVWDGKVHQHSDQYSLAVSYVELRLGRLPFDADGMGQLIRAHMQLKPDLSGMGLEEQKALERALAKEAGQRYPTCTAMLDGLGLAAARDLAPGMIVAARPASAAASLPQTLANDLAREPNDQATRYPPAVLERPVLTPETPPRSSPSSVTTSAIDTLRPALKRSVPPSGKKTAKRPPWLLPGLLACVLLVAASFLLWQFGPWGQPEDKPDESRADLIPPGNGNARVLEPKRAPEQPKTETNLKPIEPKTKLDEPKSKLDRDRPEKPKLPDGPKEPREAAKSDLAKEKYLDIDLGGGVTMKLVRIEPGVFSMGSLAGEEGRNSDERQHDVHITKPFYLGIYEVTQAQYERVMGHNPSWFSPGGGGADEVGGLSVRSFPVETVSWFDAKDFCKKVSGFAVIKERGWTVDLPTEAEWEFACRAGTKSKYCTGDDDLALSRAAWYSGNNGNRTHGVGEKAANAWGLYDMHGNVLEWCADWYDEKYFAVSPKYDPQGPADGKHRVLRGGSWNADSRLCRAAHRLSFFEPDYRVINVGFRVAVLLPPGTK